MHFLDDENIVVPSFIPNGMIVAVRANRSSDEPYWIAKVTGLLDEDPLEYSLRFFVYSHNQKRWILASGRGSTGDTLHSAVLYAGIEFTTKGLLSAKTKRQLEYVVKKD